PAVEAAIVNLEWTFWQYFGQNRCDAVPGADALDDALFAFLDEISPVSDSDDEKLTEFESYYYQSYAQLGYPDGAAQCLPPSLAPFLAYTDDDCTGELPVPAPPYDKNSMLDIDDFVEHRSQRMLFIYGEWDPWTRGKFLMGKAVDSKELTVSEGNHYAQIAD